MALLAVLMLLPLWIVGIFGRNLWTPDEPREADIAWRMSWQSEHAVPQLAGQPFLEKPPLSYWISAGALALLGDAPSAARAPNLLYAAVSVTCVGVLALELGIEFSAALVCALLAGSALLLWRVSSWLAPDACLLAGNTLALLGLWRGYTAAPGARKLFGYSLMHVGAAVGFMAKSAPGWLVPGLALLGLLLWERRFSELRRYELYAGLVLQVLIIGPWLLAVAAGAHGAQSLRTLLWHNVLGRFTRLDAPAALDYTSGHRNRPGKYLLELPLYLLPWTFLVFAAAVKAVRAALVARPWRFAAGASVPLLLLLSLAATARDIYAAPALLGLLLLVGLWLPTLRAGVRPLERWCLQATRVLIGLICAALIGVLAVLGLSGSAPRAACALVAGLMLLLVPAMLLRSHRAQRRAAPERSLLWCYGAYAAALCLSALLVLPVIDSWQDLGALAARVRSDTTGAPLALLDPDETTQAIIDHGSARPVTELTGDAPAREVQQWFAAQSPAARVLVHLPGRGAGPLTRWLGQFHAPPAPGDGVAGELVASAAATLVQRYELPEGRRYALLAPNSNTNRAPEDSP